MTAIRQSRADGGESALFRWFTAPVDLASLAAFRALFGLVMAASMVRFLAKGWVSEIYLRPRFHFPYPGFEWIRPWPDEWMHIHFGLLAILALMIAAGFCYRAATVLFCLGFTYVELLDQTSYLNHYYLVSLFSGLLIFLPAHRAWSVDAWWKPSLQRDVAPACALNLLRFQIAVVYLFAGLAKLNSDWLLRAQPLRIWLAARSDLPLIGSLLEQEWVAFAASWFGAFYDLTIVFFLLRRRTRPAAFLAVVVFHVATWLLFNIGMFPWIMIASSTLFFAPDWPRRLLTACATIAERLTHGGRWSHRLDALATPAASPMMTALRRPRLAVALLGAYAAVQVLLPLRPYLYNSEHPAWTYQGFNWAWQVMVAEKTGHVEFHARDPDTGWSARIRASRYITPRQETLMAQDPFLIRQLARHIAQDVRTQGHARVEVFVDAFAALNGHPSQRLIDPNMNLAGTTNSGWILPWKTQVSPANTGIFNAPLTFTGNDFFNPALAPGLQNQHAIQLTGLVTDTADHWRTQNFGPGATNSGTAADFANPTGQSIANPLKSGLGLNPLTAYPPSTGFATALDASGYLRMNVQQNLAAADLTFAIQVTGDLSAPDSWNAAKTTVEHDTATLLQARDNVPLSAGQSRFIRLHVRRP